MRRTCAGAAAAAGVSVRSRERCRGRVLVLLVLLVCQSEAERDAGRLNIDAVRCFDSGALERRAIDPLPHLGRSAERHTGEAADSLQPAPPLLI